jgi:hypothetical protein
MGPKCRPIALLFACALLSACGGGVELIKGGPVVGVKSGTPQAGQKIGFPEVATKNTTRVSGGDPIVDAAGVALAVYPSATSGTYPPAVTIAPTDDPAAAIAASVFMAPPIRAPILLSGRASLPSATADALRTLHPSGAGVIDGVQAILVGDVPRPAGLRASAISGGDPYTLAAAVDRFVTAAAGKPSHDVVIASADHIQYAMPAAGWAAESGNPVLFVSSTDVPEATRQALLSHQKPRIYVLGPPSVIPDAILAELKPYGTVSRVGSDDPAANSVAFAIYRDPPCPSGQPCAHVPGSFGWAMTSPGHGYTLINASRPLDAAASAPLSSSGSYGPQLLIDDPATLPTSVVNFFLNFATPGYTQEGPTAAVYNHGWVIGDSKAITIPVQAEMDSLLEVVPQK